MPKLTVQSTMGELARLPELGEFARYVLYTNGGYDGPEGIDRQPISSVAAIGWSPEGMVNGLNFVMDRFSAGDRGYFVYPPEECLEDPQKKDVNLIRLTPETIDPSKPWLLLIAGDGTGTQVAGWPQEALDFLESL